MSLLGSFVDFISMRTLLKIKFMWIEGFLACYLSISFIIVIVPVKFRAFWVKLFFNSQTLASRGVGYFMGKFVYFVLLQR